MKEIQDLTGQRFGKFVVIRFVRKYISPSGKSKDRIWECQCDCGNVKMVHASTLRMGTTKSCGCGRRKRGEELMLGKPPKITLPEGMGSLKSLYRSYKFEAKYRKLDFELSLDDFSNMTKQHCFYCGIPPSQVTKYKQANGQYIYNGVDRVDNTRGYILENCVPCCETCNRAKRMMTVNDFIEWICRVYENFAFPNSVESSLEEQEISK